MSTRSSNQCYESFVEECPRHKQMREALEWIAGTNGKECAVPRVVAARALSETSAVETNDELQQLRRIHQAALTFANACEQKSRIPNAEFADLCYALLDARDAGVKATGVPDL